MKDNHNEKMKPEEVIGLLAKKIHGEYVSKQQKFFSLLGEMDKFKVYVDLYNKNIYEISMFDQVEVMKLTIKVMEKQKEICEKYNFEEQEEEDV